MINEPICGTEIYEISIFPNKGWKKLTKIVSFDRTLSEIPKKIIFKKVRFDGMGKLELVNITKKHFVYSVYATDRGDGVKSVQFDWEVVK
ncbi:MAG: hypothetical protein BV456_03100 [Thermoplasmata archaeon M8B2D]|nr:MAG: hypothetical protein BV456_03100 [Thermoplasmata archaeon M8B2D]